MGCAAASVVHRNGFLYWWKQRLPGVGNDLVTSHIEMCINNVYASPLDRLQSCRVDRSFWADLQ